MPFKEKLTIRLENKGNQAVAVEGSVLSMPFDWNDRALHFRARWRVDHNMVGSNQDVQDLPFLLANGKGVYVGSVSYLLNPAAAPTPWGNWWGEGDEKVLVDDDTVPSIFGTGSEDYYNYSWSAPDIFFYPYCGQPRNDGPGNRGFVTNFRWHILDPIPFQDNIRFYMELFHHEPTPGLSYARIGYHYARPGLTDDHQVIMPEDVRFMQLPENWQPAALKGARNSVFHSSEKVIADIRSTDFRTGSLWQGSRVLVWYPEKTGETKDLVFNIETPGKKRVVLAFGLTPQSGKVSFKLDGEPVKLSGNRESVDLFRPYRTIIRAFPLEVQELTAGKHVVTLVYEGENEKVIKPEIDIDFIWIQSIEN